MEPSTLELKVPRRTLVRSTSNRRQHSLLLPLPPSRGAQRTWGRARTPPLFRHRYSSQLGLLHIASDLFSSITVHYDELQSFSLSTRLHPHFLLFEAFLAVLPPHLRAASKVNFHDFARFLAKSGCLSHPPPKIMCRPMREDTLSTKLGRLAVVQSTFCALIARAP